MTVCPDGGTRSYRISQFHWPLGKSTIAKALAVPESYELERLTPQVPAVMQDWIDAGSSETLTACASNGNTDKLNHKKDATGNARMIAPPQVLCVFLFSGARFSGGCASLVCPFKQNYAVPPTVNPSILNVGCP